MTWSLQGSETNPWEGFIFLLGFCILPIQNGHTQWATDSYVLVSPFVGPENFTLINIFVPVG